MLLCEIISKIEDVNSKLDILGLTRTELKEVLEHIYLTINSQTEDHPSWGKGITAASEGIFALRNVLKPKNWSGEEEKGFALTVNPENTIALNIAKGDEGVGHPKKDVATHSDKGICSQDAVSQNQHCLEFMKTPETSEMKAKHRQTWYILYRVHENIIYSEISLPSKHIKNEIISEWAKRIILPNIAPDQIEAPSAGIESTNLEFNIKRK